MIDPVDLTKELIRCPSVTPEEGGALALLERVLAPAGFVCTRCDRNGIANLYARWGGAERVFAFNGHTDVVPPGDLALWRADPFAAVETPEGEIRGRGAVDIKAGGAAFGAEALDVGASGAAPEGAGIALLITGDEEGDGVDGTTAILDWMAASGERIDACVVGEPTSRVRFGDMIKIGRRGSLTAFLTARGRQGHSAYPDRALNPLPPFLKLLCGLAEQGLDDGTTHFQPSTLAITSVDVGNTASNVIPATARATVNIRFNNRHSARSLETWLRSRIARAVAEAGDPAFAVDMTLKASGEAFLTPPGALSEIAVAAIAETTGAEPELSTSGGTSDARFVKAVCPVVEVGLVGDTMHQVDERAPAEDVRRLARVYRGMLTRYFADFAAAR